MDFLKAYKTKWLPADIVFVMDAISNSAWADSYHSFLTSLGLDPFTVNVIISIMEVVRIGGLLYQKHKDESKAP
jgi:hypothetical protein